MSTPALADDSGAQRWYTHPKTGETFLSVTSALDYIAKFGLVDWSAGMAADAALDSADRITRAAQLDPCNTFGEDACGMCRACVRAWLASRHDSYKNERADIGGRFHKAAEARVLGGPGATVDKDVQPYVDAWLEWSDDVKAEYLATEMTVISRTWGYAGTLDGALKFGKGARLPDAFAHLAGKRLLFDYKTGKSVGKSEGWQVNAYRHADVALMPNGDEEPLPEVDSGLIIHVRPEGVRMREVYCTPRNFNHFAHVLRVAEGMMAPLGDVLSRPSRVPTRKGASV